MDKNFLKTPLSDKINNQTLNNLITTTPAKRSILRNQDTNNQFLTNETLYIPKHIKIRDYYPHHYPVFTENGTFRHSYHLELQSIEQEYYYFSKFFNIYLDVKKVNKDEFYSYSNEFQQIENKISSTPMNVYKPYFEKLMYNRFYHELKLMDDYNNIPVNYDLRYNDAHKIFDVQFNKMIISYNMYIDEQLRKNNCKLHKKDKYLPCDKMHLSTFEHIVDMMKTPPEEVMYASLDSYEKLDVDIHFFSVNDSYVKYPDLLIKKFSKILASKKYKYNLEFLQDTCMRKPNSYEELLQYVNDTQFCVLVMNLIHLCNLNRMVLNYRNFEFMFYWRLYERDRLHIEEQERSNKTGKSNLDFNTRIAELQRKNQEEFGVSPYNYFNNTKFFPKDKKVIELQSGYSLPDYYTCDVTEYFNDDLYSHYPVKDPRGGNWTEFVKLLNREKNYDIEALRRKGWIFPDDFNRAHAQLEKFKSNKKHNKVDPNKSYKPIRYSSNSYIRTRFVIPPVNTKVYEKDVKDQSSFRKYCQQKAFDMNPTNGYYITGNLITSTLYERYSNSFSLQQCNFFYAKDKQIFVRRRIQTQSKNIFSEIFDSIDREKGVLISNTEDHIPSLFDNDSTIGATINELHKLSTNVEDCLLSVIHDKGLLMNFFSYIPMKELINAYARMTDAQFCEYLIILIQNMNDNLLRSDYIPYAKHTPFKDVVFEILSHCEEISHYMQVTTTDENDREYSKVIPVRHDRKWGQFLHKVIVDQCNHDTEAIEELYSELIIQSIIRRNMYVDRRMTVDESLFSHIFTFVETSYMSLQNRIIVEDYFDKYCKFEEQGNVQGQENTGLFAGNIKINHVHSLDVRDFARLMAETSEASLTNIMKFCVKITCLIAGLCTSTSYTNAISIIVSFLTDVPGLFNLLSNRIDALVKFLSNKIPTWLGAQRQAGPEDDTEDFEVLLGTAVTGAFVDTFAPDLSKHFSNAAWGFCKGLRKQFEKDVQISISSLIGEFLKGLYFKIKLAIDERDVSYLWGKTNPKQWMTYASTYTNYFNILIQNGNTLAQQSKEVLKLVDERKLPEQFRNPVSYHDFMTVIKEHLDEGLKMESEYQRASFSNKISIAVSHFKSFVTEQEVKGKMQDLRIPPFSILLYGPPGQGKTTIAANIKAAIATAYNLDNSSSSVYNWVNNVNFQDMFTHIPWCVILDDIDQNLAANSAGVPNHAEIWCALVNSKLFAIEKANLNEKGKYTFNGLLAFFLTNNYDCAVNGKIGDVSAFYRRFNLAFEYKLKPEFQKELENGVKGYNPMDIDKVKDYTGFDMYNIIEMKFSGNAVDPWIPVQVFESLEDFVPYIVKKFGDYLQDRKSISEQVDNYDLICKKCFVMNTPNKKCVHSKSEEELKKETIQHNQTVVFNRKVHKTLPLYKHPNVIEEQGGKASKMSYDVSNGLSKSMLNFAEETDNRLIPAVIKDKGKPDVLELSKIYLKHSFDLPYKEFEEFHLFATDYLVEQEKQFHSNFSQLSLREELCKRSAFASQAFWNTSGKSFIDYTQWFIHDQDAAKYRMLAVTGLNLASTALAIILIVYSIRHTFEPQALNLSNKPNPSGWVRKIQENDRFIPERFSDGVTWTREELIRSITNNLVYVKCPTLDKDKKVVYADCYASFVKPNVIMFPYHLISNIVPDAEGKKMLTMTFGNHSRDTEITPFNHYKSGDLCLLRVSNQGSKSGIYARFMAVNQTVNCYDEVMLIHLNKNFSITNNHTVIIQGVYHLKTNAYTAVGDCGALYIGRMGDHWRILAMHVMAIFEPQPQGTGILISQQTIDTLLGNELIENQVVTRMNNLILDPLRHSKKDLNLHDFPKYSEIYSAMSNMPSNSCIYTYGFLPEITSNSEKIRTKMSLIAVDCRPLTSEYCERDDYWQVPKVKGEMIDGKWVSCYSECFDVFNLKIPDNNYLWMAMIDYLQGINSLFTKNYGTISDYDVYKGVLFTEINSINMKTSVGPPWNRSKYLYLNPYNPDEVLVHPELQKLIDELEIILEKSVPGIYAQCVRKDEPVKYNKLSRIFCCLPYSVNHVMKKYGSCVEMFMRNNPSFFECAVGINMTSRECNTVIDHLMRVDPSLSNVFDADFKRFDKAWSSELFDIVSLTMYAITAAINGEALKNFRLVQALKHTIYNMKGDLFHCFWNPSGNQWTVTLNSILVSIMYRYVYYKTCKTPINLSKISEFRKNFSKNPIPSNFNCTFRRDVALMTYGDDNVFSLSKHYKFPDNFEKIFKDELGMTITSASKQAFRPLTISEISFLKRYFVWNDELKSYLPPLDMKAIIRMLVCKKESILSDVDHAATAITNALRELVYHGPNMYNKFYTFLVDEVIYKKHPEILQSSFLNLQTYDYWWELVKNDSFSTWTPLQMPSPPVLDGSEFELQTKDYLSVKSQNSKMSPITNTMNKLITQIESENLSKVQIQLQSDGATPTEISKTEESYPNSHILGTQTQEIYENNTEGWSIFQQMPANSLKSFMHRPALVYQNVISTTAVYGDAYAINVWAALMSNVTLKEKLSNFAYIRSDVDVEVTVAVPGNCFGLYAVSALAQGGTPTLSRMDEFLHAENVCQVDHYGLIDLSKNNTVKLRLPFLWPYDYAELPNGAYASWMVYLTCLQPIQTAIAGGYANGKFTVFASFVDNKNFQLVTADNQSSNSSNYSGLSAVTAKNKVRTLLSATAAQIGKSIGLYTDDTVPIVEGLSNQVLSSFGFSKNNTVTLNHTVTHRSTSSVANTDGPLSAAPSSLLSSQHISSNPIYSGGDDTDIMSFPSLFDRYTLCGNYLWDTSLIPGTILCTIPVTPGYGINYVNGLSIGPAGYYGSHFNFWMGGMKYWIYIPVSKLHQGTLQILWSPTGTFATEDTTVLNNAVIQIQANNCLEVVIDFAQIKPKRMSLNYVSGFTNSDYVNGYMRIVVLNNIVAQQTNTSTNVIIFQKSLPNMQFFQFVDRCVFPNSSISYNSFQYSSQMQYQVNGAIGTDMDQCVSISLVAPTNQYPIDSAFSGEIINSARVFLSKPSQLKERAGSTINGVNRLGPFVENGNDFLTVCRWALLPFVGVAADEVIQIFPRSPCWIGACRNTNNDVYTNTYGDTKTPNPLAPLTYSGPQLGAEFTIPYYTRRKFVLCREAADDGGGTVVYTYSAVTPNDFSFIPFLSLSSNARVVQFRQIPYLKPTNQATPAPWFTGSFA